MDTGNSAATEAIPKAPPAAPLTPDNTLCMINLGRPAGLRSSIVAIATSSAFCSAFSIADRSKFSAESGNARTIE